jgi:hypothetical protein
MLTGSIPKLLQEARAIQKALEQMGENVPAGISAAEMASRTDALENVVNQINMVNAEKTRLVDSKTDIAQNASDYIVQVRSTIKGVLGADSYEYDMVGGTRKSERKKPKKKADGTE